VKQRPPEKHDEKHQGGEYEQQLAMKETRIKELENENFLLKVGKQAAEQVVTKLGDYIKEDREHYTTLMQQNNNQLAKYSRRVGQLETEIKHRQLKAPDRDTTAADHDDLDDAATIEAEFSEGPASAQDTPPHVAVNNSPQP
jgi:phage host-nuclease inhibitor protein Gam